MHSRKLQEQRGIHLPDDWSQKIKDLLDSIYSSDLEKTGLSFEVFGQTFPDEVLVGICLSNSGDNTEIPVSYLMSADLDSKSSPEKTLDTLVDSVGIFFDTFFQTKDWNDYEAAWKEASFKGQDFHYQVTRENIKLSIMADKLLGEI